MPLFPFHKTLETIRAYDARAEEYAARWGGLILDDDLDRFSGLLPAGSRVLDLGCGPGRDLRQLEQRGLEPIGTDRSAGMLRVARREGVAPLVLADVRRLPFETASFAGVWACASLLHVPRAELPLVLAETRRVLQAQGVVYIAVKEGVGSEWKVFPDQLRVFYVYHQSDELMRIVRSSGFQVLSIDLSDDHLGRGRRWITLFARRGDA